MKLILVVVVQRPSLVVIYGRFKLNYFQFRSRDMYIEYLIALYPYHRLFITLTLVVLVVVVDQRLHGPLHRQQGNRI